ncbi:Pentatricopeptide repeat [Macleaya cordata]|uniref:Pentatricopeptide repeat n=1 Tax=Macleaya cordata TaxID=56857 RepID=A0A200PT20_MACCD|nr:Pentatricopeptide repeat [Macleaya cordata]
MKHVTQIQTQLLTNAPPSLDPNLIAVKLIGVCATHAKLRHAALIFNQLPNANLFAWNAILKAYAQNNEWFQTLRLFNYQLSSPTAPHPDEYTFTSVLKACSGIVSITDGKKIHAFVAKMGYQSNLFVSNSLVDMYFKFGFPRIARILFDEMLVKDIVSWNTLVSGYSLCGNIDSARWVFDQMIEKNLISWSAMITGYARSGDLDSARRLFDEMPERNVVSWNAMIAGYAQNETYSDAIDLFREMQQVGGVKPNDVTLVSVLSACAHLGALDLGKWIDLFINRSRMELNLFLGNALADMFAKCGCLVEAMRVFDKMQERDVISWSIIISGLAMHGHAEEAFAYFFEMLESEVTPNEITFMGLLTACTHAGLVEKGLKYFNLMEEVYGITPKIEHYGCMVDLLSRSGRLNEAEDLITSMPIKPNVIVWGALLGGCRIYKDIERGERVVQQILELDSEHSGSYVYLANVYASMGRLDDAANCRMKMRENGVMKIPGCSWIEVDNTVHEFFMGDRSHPQAEKIYSIIRKLGSRMKLAGYRPNTDLVVHNVDEEEKEDALSTHSEKLAIAFGLISTSEGTTIRVVKNLRVCNDCHEAAKIISKLVRREIIVRDRSRFHIFREGICSCNDYW